MFQKKFEDSLYKMIMENPNNPLPKAAKEDLFSGVKAMYLSTLRNVDKGFVKKDVAKQIIATLVNAAMVGTPEKLKIKKEFIKKHGHGQPSFLVLSPTKWCNLKCCGCYASSSSALKNTLEWELVDKIITDAHNNFGMRFFVISGGEPMAYKSNNKTIMDLFRKWKDCYFLMYTNGTLISEKIAKEMAELGNITPGISIEGYEKETDARRGKGVFKKILQAIDHLKKAGVPFGVSVTATQKNVKILLQDKFYDKYFDELGASYMWMFQYMPIGRGYLQKKLMLTPEQRLNLFKVWRHVMKDKQYFVADFWNSANLSKGCISCAKESGYFYIDWDGKIMPCVFIPYYKDNIRDIYKSGKTLEDAIMSDLFKEGRKWQTEYMTGRKKCGNALRPCFIRDHHREFYDVIKSCHALPEDDMAKDALKDKKYHEWLIDYDKKLKKLMEPYWEKEYLNKK